MNEQEEAGKALKGAEEALRLASKDQDQDPGNTSQLHENVKVLRAVFLLGHACARVLNLSLSSNPRSPLSLLSPSFSCNCWLSVLCRPCSYAPCFFSDVFHLISGCQIITWTAWMLGAPGRGSVDPGSDYGAGASTHQPACSCSCRGKSVAR